MNPSHNKRPKLRAMTGARLQRARYMYSGKGALKSQKFPLTSPNEQYYRDLALRIKEDYKALTGTLQLSDFVNNGSVESYSVLEFLVDCWRAGMIFAPTAAQFTDLLSRLNGDTGFLGGVSKTLQDRGTEQVYDAQAIVENIMKLGEIRANTGESKVKAFETCFSSAYREAHPSEVRASATRWLTTCRGKGQEVYREFFTRELGIQFPILASNRTCTLVPELPLAPDASADDTVKRLMTIVEDHTDSKQIEGLLGLANNQTALSNFFTEIFPALREGDMDSLIRTFAGDFPQWQTGHDLIDRLQWLSTQTKRLPAAPQVASNWSQYRTLLGGKLTSWLSNSLNREDVWRVRLEENKSTLEKLLREQTVFHESRINTDHQRRMVDKVKERALAIIAKTQPSLALTDALHPIYNSLIADYAQILNECVAALEPTKKEEKTLEQYKKVKQLDKKWGFFGSSKVQKYQDFLSLVPRLRANIHAVDVLMSKCRAHMSEAQSMQEDEEKKRILQRYLDKRSIISSPRYTDLLTRAFAQIHINIKSIGPNQVLFQNKRARQQRGIITFDASQVNIVDFISSLNLHTMPPIRHAHIHELFDWIELAKTTVSVYVRVMPDLTTALSELFAGSPAYHDDVIHEYIATYGDVQKMSDIAPFLQQQMFARIRGDLTTMSLSRYVERNVVNFVGIDSAFNFVLSLKDATKQLDRTNRKQWGIWEKRYTGGDTLCVYRNAEALGSSAPKLDHTVSNDHILSVTTSNYQIGWLDRILPIDHRTSDFTYKIGEISLIVETPYQIRWEDKSERPSVTQSAKDMIYAVVPITLTPNKQDRTPWIPHRFIGVDVGEYGLAYSVIKVENDTVIIDKSGFIIEPELRKIADHMKSSKERQRHGTFSVQETLLQAYREQAVKAMRNRIHDLILRYKAPVVYEASISNFETGSSRLTKVYHTLKIADTPEYHQDVEKIEANQTWGERSQVRGSQVSAYGTSRTCLACKRCYQAEIEDRFADHTPTVSGDTMLLGDLPVHVFGDVEYAVKQHSSGALVQLAYDYARPPSEAPHLKHLNLEEFVAKRGNSAVFICPLCGHVSDADIQASVCIALKQAFKETKSREEWEEYRTKEGNVRFRMWLDWVKTLQITPIKFVSHDIAHEIASSAPKAHPRNDA